MSTVVPNPEGREQKRLGVYSSVEDIEFFESPLGEGSRVSDEEAISSMLTLILTLRESH